MIGMVEDGLKVEIRVKSLMGNEIAVSEGDIG